MSWQESTLHWPAVPQNIQAQSEQVLDQVADNAADAVGRLDTVAGNVSFNRHPLSGEATGLLHLRQQLESLLCKGQILSVHPYQFGVGNKTESGPHLTPKNAVQCLAEKLLDTDDENRPIGERYVIGIMLAEQNLADLARSASQVFAVLPIPELGMVARRASRSLNIESEKLALPAGIKQPRFQPGAALHCEPLRSALLWQGAQIAQLESMAADRQSPIAKLAALANKRTAQLKRWKTDIDQLKESDIKVRTFEAKGTPEVINTLLKQSNPPGYDHTHSFAALFISETPLTFFRELFL